MEYYTVGELAEHVSGRVDGDPERRVSGVAPAEAAGPDEVTYVVDRKHGRRICDSRPGAVLVPREMSGDVGDATLIRVDSPQVAFSKVVRLFHPEPEEEPGVHPTAVIGSGVRMGEEVSIGPFAVLGREVRIGRATTIGAHTVIGAGARIGEECSIADSCSVHGSVRMADRVRVLAGARLGTEGYGYAQEDGEPVHIPQVGGCVIHDDVEIGANSTVDRGTLGDTVIGARTKIDNLVHVGHNVRIGESCMIVAQVGVAGSVTIEDGAQLAGQAGIAGHLTIGAGARIAAQAGVIGDVPAGATYSGYPARPHREAMRASAALFRVPDVLRRLRRVEATLGLEDEDEGGEG